MKAYRQTNDESSEVQISYLGKKVELPIIFELQPTEENVLELKVEEFFDEEETAFYSIRPVNAAIKALETADGFNGKYAILGAQKEPESKVTIHSFFHPSTALDKVIEIYFRPK